MSTGIVEAVHETDLWSASNALIIESAVHDSWNQATETLWCSFEPVTSYVSTASFLGIVVATCMCVDPADVTPVRSGLVAVELARLGCEVHCGIDGAEPVVRSHSTNGSAAAPDRRTIVLLGDLLLAAASQLAAALGSVAAGSLAETIDRVSQCRLSARPAGRPAGLHHPGAAAALMRGGAEIAAIVSGADQEAASAMAAYGQAMGSLDEAVSTEQMWSALVAAGRCRGLRPITLELFRRLPAAGAA